MAGTNTNRRGQTNLKSIAIEYRCSGGLDGQTLAPIITLDPTSPNYFPPDPVDNVYRYPGILQQNIGLIDLSLVDGTERVGGIGDRYVKGFFSLGVGPYGAAARLFIGDTIFADQGIPVETVQVVEVITPTLPGSPAIFYRSMCFVVPQGSYLGITGTGVPDSEYSLVRVQVWAPDPTVWSIPLIEQACCCEQEERAPPPPGD